MSEVLSTEPMDVSLLCGHWTFFRGGAYTARCDLPAGHDGTLHKFWTNPAAGESFTWNETFEKHERPTA